MATMQLMKAPTTVLARRQLCASRVNSAGVPAGMCRAPHLPRRADAVCMPAASSNSGSPTPVPEVAGGFSLNLGTPAGAATTFGFLTAAFSVITTLFIALPQPLLQLVFPAVTSNGVPALVPVDTVILRLTGAILFISVAVEYCLKDAAANHRLHSSTYQRLLLTSVLKSVGFLVAFALAKPLWSAPLLPLYPSIAMVCLFISGVVFVTSNSTSGSFKFPAVGVSLLPTGIMSFIYLVFTGIYLWSTAMGCQPAATNPLLQGITTGPATNLLVHSMTPSLFLAAVTTLTLKDAADRGRLGASTFKLLNLGLAAMELSYLSVAVIQWVVPVGLAALSSDVRLNLGLSAGMGLVYLLAAIFGRK